MRFPKSGRIPKSQKIPRSQVRRWDMVTLSKTAHLLQFIAIPAVCVYRLKWWLWLWHLIESCINQNSNTGRSSFLNSLDSKHTRPFIEWLHACTACDFAISQPNGVNMVVIKSFDARQGRGSTTWTNGKINIIRTHSCDVFIDVFYACSCTGR